MLSSGHILKLLGLLKSRKERDLNLLFVNSWNTSMRTMDVLIIIIYYDIVAIRVA